MFRANFLKEHGDKFPHALLKTQLDQLEQEEQEMKDELLDVLITAKSCDRFNSVLKNPHGAATGAELADKIDHVANFIMFYFDISESTLTKWISDRWELVKKRQYFYQDGKYIRYSKLEQQQKERDKDGY